MPSDSRDLDIVLLGATGFTGELIATYLADHAPSSVRIGLAGRNPAKLEAVAGRKPLLVSAVSGEGVTELLRVAVVAIREARAVVAAGVWPRARSTRAAIIRAESTAPASALASQGAALTTPVSRSSPQP